MSQKKKEKTKPPSDWKEIVSSNTGMQMIQARIFKAYQSPEELTDDDKDTLATGRMTVGIGEVPMPILHLLLANEATNAVMMILKHIVKKGLKFDLTKRWDFEGKTLLILAAKMGPPGEEICEYILQNLDLFGGESLLTFKDVNGCIAAHYLYMYGSRLVTEFNQLQTAGPEIQDFKHGYRPAEYLSKTNPDFINTVARSVSIDASRSRSATSNELMLEGSYVINETRQRIKSLPSQAALISGKLFFEVPNIGLEPRPLHSKTQLTSEQLSTLRTTCQGFSPVTLADQINHNRQKLGNKLKIIVPAYKQKEDIKVSTLPNFHAPIKPGQLFTRAQEHLTKNQFKEAVVVAQQIVDFYKKKEQKETVRPTHLRGAYYLLGRAQLLQFQSIQSTETIPDLALLNQAETHTKEALKYDKNVQQAGSADLDSKACQQMLLEITNTQTAISQTSVKMPPAKDNSDEEENNFDEEDTMAIRMSNPLRQCIIL